MKYREGFIKNRYIGRTFIMPGQEQREKSVRRKLNAIDLEFRGKNVLLVDDSIVRGTTSAQIIELAREAGAEQGVLRLRRAAGALPERLRHRHAGGERAGGRGPHGRAKWRALIGADWLIYQDLEDLVAACQHDDARIEEFDTSCFSGEYVTGDVTPEYLERLQLERSDAAKVARRERHAQAQNRPRDLSLAGASDPRRALLLELLQAGLRAVDGRSCVRAALAARARPMLARPCGWPPWARRQPRWRAARTRHSAARVGHTLLITRDAQSAALLAARPDVQIVIGAHPVAG